MPTAKAAAPKKKLSIKKSPKKAASKKKDAVSEELTATVELQDLPTGPVFLLSISAWKTASAASLNLARYSGVYNIFNDKGQCTGLGLSYKKMILGGRLSAIKEDLVNHWEPAAIKLGNLIQDMITKYSKPLNEMDPDEELTTDEASLHIMADQLLLFKADGQEVIGKVRSCSMTYPFFGSPYIRIEMMVVGPRADGQLVMKEVTHKIPTWNGPMKVKDLPILVASESDKKRLSERFSKYKDCFSGNASYRQLNGVVTYGGWWKRELVARGRAMIDAKGFNRFERDEWNFALHGTNDSEDNEKPEMELDVVERDYGFMVWPFVPVFVFRDKMWGTARLTDVSDIKFREDAMDFLVLEEDVKSMLVAIGSSKGGYTDFIDGKGGGATILLDGPPGVGKTTTAEVIAEKFHRPLYMVSVGELGVTPADLEAKLKTILEVAESWNAVVLLDEGDIFLEERGIDILRNAMVGIFLRCLEYHNGLMFVTTNRVGRFDQAALSRMALTVHYDKKEGEEYRQVWHNQLVAANEDPSEHEALASTHADCDGRRAKNLIRIAQMLRSSGDKRSIREVIDSIAKFTSKKEK